jgi:hypothetical protein
MNEEIKMKEIEPKSWKDREDVMAESVDNEKTLPSGYLYFDDVPVLKEAVMGSCFIIKQKVLITSINKTSVSFDIEKIGAVKEREKREVKDEDED